jgi:hypothetical protein
VTGAREPRGANEPVVPGPTARIADEPPPFWGRWGRIYLLVAGLLLVEAALFYGLTRWAS